MEFRKEISGIVLAVCAGILSAVAVGQNKGVDLDDLLLPDADAAAKPAAKAPAPAPEPAKPATKAPAPAPAKPAAKAPASAPEPVKPVTQAPAPAPAKPAAKAPAPAPEPVKPIAQAPASAAAKPAVQASVAAPAKPAEKAPELEPVKPVAKAVAPAPEKPVAQTPAPAKAADSAETDEIDLDNLDDSAVSAKGRPVVKLAAPKPDEAAEGGAAEKEASAPATGSEIAARFLAADETALVDIMSDDATLTDILRQFRRATGANIIYAESSNLQQRVSVSLRHVPWLQGMKSILNSRGFRVESTGGIHFIKEDKLSEPIFTRTFQLNHASVKELAELFNESYGTKGKDGKFVKSVATPFPGANTIVVTANDRVLADCEAIIKAVDKAVPQIYIEARFIELSNEAMHKIGLQWNQLESWGATVKNLEGGLSYNNGRPANYGSRVTSSTISTSSDGTTGSYSENQTIESIPATAVGTGISGSSFNRSTEDMAWHNARGFSGQLSADDFRLAMSAFESMSDVKIFSNPKIIVSNGKEAMFDRTTKFPNVTLTSAHEADTGYTRSDAKLEIIPGEDNLFAKSAFFSWGITLSVKPRISPDGLISVEIVPSISELDKTVTSDGFYQVYGGTDAPYGRYPILLFKRLTTDFTMKDGATAVIGGLSKTEEGDVDSGIPYLRKIPWIGPKLFGWKSREKMQTEILIFVTVGIADPANLPEDVGLPKNAVRGREYVEKRMLEPGDRFDPAKNALSLDLRAMDEQLNDIPPRPAPKADEHRGTVTITPVTPETAK